MPVCEWLIHPEDEDFTKLALQELRGAACSHWWTCNLYLFFWIGEGGISVMGLTGIEHIPPGDPPLPLKIPASPSHQNSSLPCPRRFPPSTDAAALSDRGTVLALFLAWEEFPRSAIKVLTPTHIRARLCLSVHSQYTQYYMINELNPDMTFQLLLLFSYLWRTLVQGSVCSTCTDLWPEDATSSYSKQTNNELDMKSAVSQSLTGTRMIRSVTNR